MKKHLKRLSTPKFWRIKKKETKWVTRPRPGPHKKFESIPLLVFVRNILRLADTSRDAKKIIKQGEILVDGKPRKDHKYSIGLMDFVEIPKINKKYRIVSTEKDLTTIELSHNEKPYKLCRIKNKKILKDGILQLNLHDGKNLLIKTKNSKEDIYKTGDSLLIELPSQKIKEHVGMNKGNLILIIGGQNQGQTAKIKEIVRTRSREPNKVVCKSNGKEFEAIKDYVFVIGKTKPLIEIVGKIL